MRALATTAIAILAVAGLAACNRGAANNGAAPKPAANNAAAPAANNAAAPALTAGMDPAAFRTMFLGQCAQEAQSNPNIPDTIDFASACGCAYDRALANRPDPFAFSQTPEAQSVFNQALLQCVVQQSAGATSAAPPSEGAEEPDGE